MSKKEEQSEAYIKPTILYRNNHLEDDNWELGLDYLDFTGYEVQCAFEAGWNAAIDKACEWLKEIFSEYENLTDYNPMEDFRKTMEE